MRGEEKRVYIRFGFIFAFVIYLIVIKSDNNYRNVTAFNIKVILDNSVNFEK